MLKKHAANIVTSIRIVLAFFGLGLLLYNNFQYINEAVAVIVFVFALDGVDGLLARYFGGSSLFGSFYDIFADRIVELLFFGFLFYIGSIQVWFILVFYFRVLITDCCRFIAYLNGNSKPSGIFLPKQIRPILMSALSRTLYGALKLALIVALLFAAKINNTNIVLSLICNSLLWCVLVFSLLRALPIVYTYGVPTIRRIFTIAINHRKEPNEFFHNLDPQHSKGISIVYSTQILFDIVVIAGVLFVNFGK